jgi:thioredoxin reductase (NADPH)
VLTDVDLLIVGAGPTGLFAAYYAGFRDLSTAIVDSLPEPGGQVTAMYPEKMIFDVAGFPAVRGRDLIAALVEQAAQWKPTYLLGRKASTLTPVAGGDGFDVGLGDGTVVRAGAVLVTAGMGEFTPRPLPSGEGWLDRGVVHFVPELAIYQDKHVIVVGGGDSAFDWALALHPVAASVKLVHRRAKFRAHPPTVRQVEALGVPIITDAEVTVLRGEPTVREVEILVKGGSPAVYKADVVVAALGFTADLGPLQSWGLKLEHRAIAVDSTGKTAVDRIYAAGDVAAYPGKVKLIATGFGEAATAVNNIAVVLNPQAHLFPGHSSDEG